MVEQCYPDLTTSVVLAYAPLAQFDASPSLSLHVCVFTHCGQDLQSKIFAAVPAVLRLTPPTETKIVQLHY